MNLEVDKNNFKMQTPRELSFRKEEKKKKIEEAEERENFRIYVQQNRCIFNRLVRVEKLVVAFQRPRISVNSLLNVSLKIYDLLMVPVGFF